jgi:hypothetical protein
MSTPFAVPSFDDDDNDVTPQTVGASEDVVDINEGDMGAEGDCGEGDDEGPATDRPDDVAAHMGGLLVPKSMKDLINAALEAEVNAPTAEDSSELSTFDATSKAPAAAKPHVVPTGEGKNARKLPGDKSFPFCFVCASRHEYGKCEREEPLFDESD